MDMAEESVLEIYRYTVRPPLRFPPHPWQRLCENKTQTVATTWNPHHIVKNKLNGHISRVPVSSKLWWETKQSGAGCKLVQVRSCILGPRDHNWNFPSSSVFFSLLSCPRAWRHNWNFHCTWYFYSSMCSVQYPPTFRYGDLGLTLLIALLAILVFVFYLCFIWVVIFL